ncbi:MAG: Re/Si-specific NAD(P)(+) transhydrogenase subunit alpha [Leptolyngbyaceae cyanobacterium bins.349]|nr:Re/Si-specific NAD(P)(+) transhydrogenase subunit alpha [Leptolyngbyaceae cyanobacterium bins.349]
MKIAIAKEIEAGERRVALIPDTVGRLVKQGFEVWVENGAGEAAHFSNEAYINAGAIIVSTPETVFSADLILKVKPPQHREDGRHEADLLKPGSTLISFLDPLGNPALCQQLADRQVTAFSMEMIPRISRAQSMDALSSQASLAGYKAVLIAAAACPKFFPMLTTAAGTIPPAKVFIIGAGVAGLQAIATARRLGAIVEAFDIRPAVKEEVQSLGAKFVEVALEEDTVAAGGYAKEVSDIAKQKTQAAISAHVKQADIVITTAQVPGKKAPLLVTAEMVAAMKPGAVIVDMAAEQGGNCAGTEAGRQMVHNDVTLIGPVNLPASMPVHASQMYAKNLLTLVQHLVKDGQLNLDFDDEITREACVVHAGTVCNQRVRDLLNNAVTVGS